MTQNLSVSYKNKPLEEVLADLKQKTNYNFVYQKQILAGTRSVTANFNDMPLTYILDRVLYNNGLDYEIVKENESNSNKNEGVLEKLPFKLPYTGSVAFWIIIASVGVGATIAGVSYIVRKKHYIK